MPSHSLSYDASYNFASLESSFQELVATTTGNVNLSDEFNRSEYKDETQDDIDKFWAHAIADAKVSAHPGQEENTSPDDLDSLFPIGDNFTNLNVYEPKAVTRCEISRGNTPITRQFTEEHGDTFTPTIITALGDSAPPRQRHQLIKLRAKISDPMVQRTINQDTPGTGDNTSTLGIVMQGMQEAVQDYKNMCYDVHVYYLSIDCASDDGVSDDDRGGSASANETGAHDDSKGGSASLGEVTPPANLSDNTRKPNSQKAKAKQRRLRKMAEAATTPSPSDQTKPETGDATKEIPTQTPEERGSRPYQAPYGSSRAPRGTRRSSCPRGR